VTSSFGPIDETERGNGFSWMLAGKILATSINGVQHLTPSEGTRVHYSSDKNRISLHGTSEFAGNGYRAGVIATANWMLTALLLLVAVSFFAQLSSLAAGTVFALPVALSGVVVGLGSVMTVFSLYRGLLSFKVVDHTHAKIETEAVEELQEQFTAGEIDQEEFDEQLEQEFEA
jgi:uncharacterized membrane protein